MRLKNGYNGRDSAVCNETCGCPVPCPGSVDCRSVNVHFLHSTNCAFCLLICGRIKNILKLPQAWTGALPQAWAQPQPKMIIWHAHAASTAAAIRAHALRMCRPWELAGPFASVVMIAHVQLALPNERLNYYVLGCIRGKQLKASSLLWWVANNVDQGWVYGLHWYIYIYIYIYNNKSEAVDVHKNYCFWMFSFIFLLCFLVGSYSKLDKNMVST